MKINKNIYNAFPAFTKSFNNIALVGDPPNRNNKIITILGFLI